MNLRFKRSHLIIAGIAVAILAALFVTGVLDWQRTRSDVETRTRQTVQRVADGVVPGLSAPADSPAEQHMAEECRANLRRIEAAKRTAAQRTSTAAGAVPLNEIIRDLGGALPACPKGGSYRVGTLEILPACSIGSNNTPGTADNHIIRGY